MRTRLSNSSILKTPASQRKAHIVEQSLEKKKDLIEKYQTEIQDLLEQIDTKQHYRKANTIQNKTSARTNRTLSSVAKKIIPQPYYQNQREYIGSGSMKDYQRLILGLQYALQAQRKKNQSLQHKNRSLQTQISNLRNVLVGPDESKSYQKTVFKQSQQKIQVLQQKVLQQKKNYQFIIQSKNEAMSSLQAQLRVITKKIEDQNKESAFSKKIIELGKIIDQLKNTITRKNVLLERYKYKSFQAVPDDSDESDDQIKKIRKIQRTKFYLQQLEIANQLIIRKNIQILNLSGKAIKNQEILAVIEMYLDKKQVRSVDLSVLENPCVNKMRILLRQKAVFQRELLTQLNSHNKRINTFQSQLANKQSVVSGRLNQVVQDNKKLTQLANNLQTNIRNLQKNLDDQRRQNQILNNQVQINKKQFVQEIKKLKGDLGTISSVTKNEFDRMKIQNLKLTQQNRSLLFLVGQKQRQIHRKGQNIKTFQNYREKINSLDMGASETQRRKIDSVSEDLPQIGSKLLLINTFSGWTFEWNKIKSWNNKKTLLNLILDKQEIRTDSIKTNSTQLLINILHDCFLHSKNVQVQQRAIILLSYYMKHDILKNKSLYVDKISSFIVRGFRQKLQGEEDIRHALLNQSTLKVMNQLQKMDYVWTYDMTNQMISVNGLKYLFHQINDGKIDDHVQMAFNVLTMIARQNQMISFMLSFNLNEIILKNMNKKYPFIVFLLYLLKTLLKSDDFMRSQKSFLEYRKIFDLFKPDQDQDVLDYILDSLDTLLTNGTFLRSLNKIQCLSNLSSVLKQNNQYKLLKKLGNVYGLIIQEIQDENIQKYTKHQIDKLLNIIENKKFSQNRFNRSIRIVLKVVEQIQQSQSLDQKVLSVCTSLYENYSSIQPQTRQKLNELIKIIFQRNKPAVNKISTQTFIGNIVESYKSTNVIEQLIFILKLLLFENQQKHTTQILRTGRQGYIEKLVTDSTTADYNVAILSLKNLLAIVKEKYSEKFITTKIVDNIMNKVLKQRSQEQYLGLTLSVLYFMSKNQGLSLMVIQANAVPKIANVMVERHDKQPIIFKSFALLQLLHTTNYKRKILNYFLSSDPHLQTLKTFNYILRRAQNKVQMGARAIFFYDFLNSKSSIQSLTIMVDSNQWMIQDLINMRNEYIGKVDPLVYKVQLLLNGMSQRSKKIRKLYQKFKVQGDISSGDEQN